MFGVDELEEKVCGIIFRNVYLVGVLFLGVKSGGVCVIGFFEGDCDVGIFRRVYSGEVVKIFILFNELSV